MRSKVSGPRKENKRAVAVSLLAVLGLLSLVCGSCGSSEESPKPVKAEVKDDASFVGSKRFKERTRKIIFIGIDGADWKIILPLIEQGKMPNLATIKENGAWGTLESFGRTLSPVVWTTIATGKMPNKHGIGDFIVKDRDSYETRPIDSTYRKTKAFWNIFTDFGISVGVIDWLVTFPPEKVDGYIITNLNNKEENKTYPPEVQAQYESEVIWDGPKWIKGVPANDLLIREKMYQMDYVERVGAAMQRNYSVDFLALYTHAIDEIQHYNWKYRLPALFRDQRWELTPEDVEKYQNVIDDFYIRADKMIGSFMKPGYTIIIVSDHGTDPFKNVRTYFRMNRLLETMGFLLFSDENRKEVDFSKTQVYEGGFAQWGMYIGVSVNLKGRETEGIVTEDRHQEMIDRLVKELSSIKIAESDRTIFNRVTRVEKYAHKDQLVSDVDMVAIQRDVLIYGKPNEHIVLNGKQYPLADYLETDSNISGGHSFDGIFAAIGEGIRPTEVPDAKMADVLPTILHMMGMPAGKDMDGEIITAIFTREYMKENPVTHVDSYDNLGTRFVVETERRGTSTADEEIKAKLRALGYIN